MEKDILTNYEQPFEDYDPLAKHPDAELLYLESLSHGPIPTYHQKALKPLARIYGR
jgi:hypothetical protein